MSRDKDRDWLAQAFLDAAEEKFCDVPEERDTNDMLTPKCEHKT